MISCATRNARACSSAGHFTRKPHRYGKAQTESMMQSLFWLPIAALAAAFAIVSGNGAKAADAAQGEHAFAKCAPCHAKDKTNGVGPGLLGVIGRHAGSEPGFRYSRAMKNSN